MPNPEYISNKSNHMIMDISMFQVIFLGSSGHRLCLVQVTLVDTLAPLEVH